MPMSKWPPRQL